MAGGVSGKPVDAAAAGDKAPVLLLFGTEVEDEAPVPPVPAHDSVPEKRRDLDCALLVLLSGRRIRIGSAEIALREAGTISVNSITS